MSEATLAKTSAVYDAAGSADAARALHLRRALAAAADHAAALLPALGLPRLVDEGFAPIDLRAAGDALDAAIETLDALDGDADAEPWLGWAGADRGVICLGGLDDREEEREHDEGWLGWGTGSQIRLTANTDDGFDPLDRGELVNEDGDTLDEHGEHDTADMEPSIGWPNDPEAVLSDALQADHDPEADPVDCIAMSMRIAQADANRDAARTFEQRARAIRQRVRGPIVPRDKDALTFVRPGVMAWGGHHA